MPGVHGTIDDLPEVLADVEPDEVMIAIPSAPGTLRAAVVSACRARGITVRTVPTVFELVQTGGALTRQLREVKVEDVLGRDPVRMEIESVGGYLTGRTVLVTGAGGSIGSELCRQIARVNPDDARAAGLQRGEPVRDRARAARRAPRPLQPWPSWPTARTRSACARSSPSSGRRSCSTPPPSSTSS